MTLIVDLRSTSENHDLEILKKPELSENLVLRMPRSELHTHKIESTASGEMYRKHFLKLKS